MTTYERDATCMTSEVNPCSVPMTRKLFSLILNGVYENVLACA